jgi:hypothetical protein
MCSVTLKSAAWNVASSIGMRHWWRRLPDLDYSTAEASARIASLPMEIRGYGPVKKAAVENVKARIADLKSILHTAG